MKSRRALRRYRLQCYARGWNTRFGDFAGVLSGQSRGREQQRNGEERPEAWKSQTELIYAQRNVAAFVPKEFDLCVSP